MDNSLKYSISCILTSFREQQPLEEKLIQKLLTSLPVHPTLAVVIRLLCCLFKKHQPLSASNPRNFIENTAEVLQIIAPILDVSPPLKNLLNAQHQQFD